MWRSRKGKHLRFTIHIDAADRSGLKFSPRLLALATIVRDQQHLTEG